jgi:hypothetical protein
MNLGSERCTVVSEGPGESRGSWTWSLSSHTFVMLPGSDTMCRKDRRASTDDFLLLDEIQLCASTTSG